MYRKYLDEDPSDSVVDFLFECVCSTEQFFPIRKTNHYYIGPSQFVMYITTVIMFAIWNQFAICQNIILPRRKCQFTVCIINCFIELSSYRFNDRKLETDVA